MHQHNTFYITLLLLLLLFLMLLVLHLFAGFASKAAFAMEILCRSKHQGKSCYARLNMRCLQYIYFN